MSAIIKLVVEVAFAIALSIFVATSPLGPRNYTLVGISLATIGAILIYSTQGFSTSRDGSPTVLWAVVTLGICIALGAMWPALPFIFFYEREKTRRHHARRKPTVDSDAPAGASGPRGS